MQDVLYVGKIDMSKILIPYDMIEALTIADIMSVKKQDRRLIEDMLYAFSYTTGIQSEDYSMGQLMDMLMTLEEALCIGPTNYPWYNMGEYMDLYPSSVDIKNNMIAVLFTNIDPTLWLLSIMDTEMDTRREARLESHWDEP